MRPRTHPRFETDLRDGPQGARADHVRPLEEALAEPANPKSGLAHQSIPRLFTVKEAAAILRLSVRSVRRLIADQKLATIRIGRAVRVREDVLIALINEGDVDDT